MQMRVHRCVARAHISLMGFHMNVSPDAKQVFRAGNFDRVWSELGDRLGTLSEAKKKTGLWVVETGSF